MSATTPSPSSGVNGGLRRPGEGHPTPRLPTYPSTGVRGWVRMLAGTNFCTSASFSSVAPPGLTSFEEEHSPVSRHCLLSPKAIFSLYTSAGRPPGYVPDSPFDITLAAWKHPFSVASSLRPWTHSLQLIAITVADVGLPIQYGCRRSCT